MAEDRFKKRAGTQGIPVDEFMEHEWEMISSALGLNCLELPYIGTAIPPGKRFAADTAIEAHVSPNDPDGRRHQ